MKTNWMVPRSAWTLGLAVALSCPGLAGCDDDGEDADGDAAPAVVTNAVTGAVTTNAVAVTDEAGTADADEPVPGAAALANVAGEWNGSFRGDEGNGHLDLDLRQTDEMVTGQFNLSNGDSNQVGTIAGNIDGRHLVLMLMVPGSGAWIELDGQVNDAVTAYTGTWTGTFGSGDFALQK